MTLPAHANIMFNIEKYIVIYGKFQARVFLHSEPSISYPLVVNMVVALAVVVVIVVAVVVVVAEAAAVVAVAVQGGSIRGWNVK